LASDHGASSAKDEFLVRFFEWSLREWDREIAEDLRLLRKVRGPSAFRNQELLESLPRDRWPEVARALTKRFHPDAVRLLGQGLDAEEKALLERCDAHRRNPSTREQANPPTNARPVTKKRLAAIVKRGLTSLGTAESLGGATEWRYTSKHEQWVIHTYLDVGGRFNDVSYSHDVAVGDEPPFLRLVSLLSWLGLSSSTRWKVLTETDGMFAADAIAELTRHFLDAAPMLAGGSDAARAR
jgi:hypothetical protein